MRESWKLRKRKGEAAACEKIEAARKEKPKAAAANLGLRRKIKNPKSKMYYI